MTGNATQIQLRKKWTSVPVTVENNQTSSGFQFVLITEDTEIFFFSLNADGLFSSPVQSRHFLLLQRQIANLVQIGKYLEHLYSQGSSQKLHKRSSRQQ